MKFCVSLLVGIALISAAIGDESGDPAEGLGCLFPVEQLPEFRQKLYEMVVECTRQKILESTGVDIYLDKDNSTTEQIRTAFNTRCASRSLFDQCWASTERQAETCSDATGFTKFRLNRKYRALEFEVGCVDNGENTAKMMEAFIINDIMIYENCARNASVEVDKPAADDQNLNAEVLYNYKLINKVLECLDGHKGGEHDALINLYTVFGTELKDKMKCLKDGADVLCKTIVENN